MPEKYELGKRIVGVVFVELHNNFHKVEIAEYSLEGDAAGFTRKAVGGWVNDEWYGRHGDGCCLSGLSGWREVRWVSIFIFLKEGSCVREVTFWFPSIFGRRETFPGY